MPAQARLWAAECFERALNEELDTMTRKLLLDTAEAWIRLADRLERGSTELACDFGLTHGLSRTLH